MKLVKARNIRKTAGKKTGSGAYDDAYLIYAVIV
jgi:hypothetical protein